MKMMAKQPWEEDNEDVYHQEQQHELKLCIHDAVGMHILEEEVVVAAGRYAFYGVGPTLHHREDVNADNNEEEKVVLQ